MKSSFQAKGLRSQTPRDHAPWIAVAGGKGGVGKTLIAINLAIQVARAGYRTLLVDLDPGLANVDVQLRLHSRWTVEDLPSGICTPHQAFLDGPGGIKVLVGRSGSTRLASGDDRAIEEVLKAVHQAARGFDVVICDTGSGIGPAVIKTAGRADLVLAVTSPDPSAITDTYALCKVLHTEGMGLPGLVVNTAASREQAMRTAGKLRSVCKKFLSRELHLVGWLPLDEAIRCSAAEQRPFAVLGSGPATADLQALVAGTLSALPRLPARSRARRRAALAALAMPPSHGSRRPRRRQKPGVTALPG